MTAKEFKFTEEQIGLMKDLQTIKPIPQFGAETQEEATLLIKENGLDWYLEDRKKYLDELEDVYKALPPWEIKKYTKFYQTQKRLLTSLLGDNKTSKPKIKSNKTEGNFIKMPKGLGTAGLTSNEILLAVYIRDKNKLHKGRQFYDTAPQAERDIGFKYRTYYRTLMRLRERKLVDLFKWDSSSKTPIKMKDTNESSAKHGKTWISWNEDRFQELLKEVHDNN